MANDLTQVANDKDFVNAPFEQQKEYLSSLDKDFAGANEADQRAYINHIAPSPLTTGKGMEHPTAPVPQPFTPMRPASRLKQQLGPDEVRKEAMPALRTAEGIGTAASLVLPGVGAATYPEAAATIARTGIGSAAGAAGGRWAGREIGGMFGPTGADWGGKAGGFIGGLVGGHEGYKTAPEAPPELGSPENPGFHAKLPIRMPSAAPKIPGKSTVFSVEAPTMTGPAVRPAGAPLPMTPAQEFAARAASAPTMDAPEVGIRGSLAKPSGRLILSPQEAASADRMQQLAKTRASQHGMLYAAGMRPGGGGRVPMLPTGTEEFEYPGPRAPEQPAIEERPLDKKTSDILKKAKAYKEKE